VLPADVAEVLSGSAQDGWEPVFLMLTVGSDGYSQVCLLSRQELELSGEVICCVVRARRTVANIRRDGQALLVVAGDEAAHYLRLKVVTVVEEQAGGTALGAAFAVTGSESDTLGVPLRPMMYHLSPRIREIERWDDGRALLRKLAAAIRPAGGGEAEGGAAGGGEVEGGEAEGGKAGG
jgi:hypothetical protein